MSNMYFRAGDEAKAHDEALLEVQIALLEKIKASTETGHGKMAVLFAESYALVSGSMTSRGSEN